MENTSTTQTAETHYACVGLDGTNLVVWGLGSTPEAARDDAREQETDGEDVGEMEIHAIDSHQAEQIRAGVVRWDLVSAS